MSDNSGKKKEGAIKAAIVALKERNGSSFKPSKITSSPTTKWEIEHTNTSSKLQNGARSVRNSFTRKA